MSSTLIALSILKFLRIYKYQKILRNECLLVEIRIEFCLTVAWDYHEKWLNMCFEWRKNISKWIKDGEKGNEWNQWI